MLSKASRPGRVHMTGQAMGPEYCLAWVRVSSLVWVLVSPLAWVPKLTQVWVLVSPLAWVPKLAQVWAEPSQQARASEWSPVLEWR